MVANVLLNEAITIVTPDDGVGQVHVFDLGLQLSMIGLGDPATEDRRDLIGPFNCSISIEEPFAQVIECGTSLEDEVVAVFHLGEEQVFTAGLFSLVAGKEGCQASQPFLAAGHQVLGSE